MRGRLIGALAAGAALVASIVMSAPANAVPATWSVSPGGPFSGAAGTTVLKVQETGVQLTCQSATAAGTAKSGTGLSNPLATLPANSTKFNNCSGPFGLTFGVTHVGTWNLNGSSYAAPVTTGTITNVNANISGPGCAANVSGSVNATYNNTTKVLTIQPNYGLIFNSVSGCLGLISAGQHASFSGAFTITPGMTVTSP
ncbi:hypothetical protein [Actinophytocola sp. KF-1]